MLEMKFNQVCTKPNEFLKLGELNQKLINNQ